MSDTKSKKVIPPALRVSATSRVLRRRARTLSREEKGLADGLTWASEERVEYAEDGLEHAALKYAKAVYDANNGIWKDLLE